MSADTNGIESVGYFDCPGGGQVVVRDGVAYIAHMKPPHGTTLVDVSDPARPRRRAEVSIADGMHSHKVRVERGVMLVNRETYPPGPPAADFAGGLGVYDVTAFAPPVPEGASRVSSNDVAVDARGLLYLLDRTRGMHIVERT